MAQQRVLKALEPLALGMPRTLFLLSSCKVKGGNYSTIARIRSHLVKHGHTCMLWDVAQLEETGDINQVLEEHQVDLLIGIHAFRTGKLMKDSKVPYILILGGTDVNEFCKNEDKMTVMTSAVNRAGCVISFCDSLQKKASALWPNLPPSQMTVITQAVITKPSVFSLHRHLQDNNGICDSEDRHIFLLVGAVRAVKNPIYLMETFTELHRVNQKILYVIIGPVSDERYYNEEFQPALQRSEGVVYIPGLLFEDTHKAMHQCFALVNSSESEGMSLAILEAMQLNTPVLARNIPGNSAVIQDGQNGLLFSTPQECGKKALRLLSDDTYRAQLVFSAGEYVAVHHSLKQEEAAYVNIVQQICKDDKDDGPICVNGHR
ncbi:glycosyltransferase 1 domain-containing protein 1-like isoform X1 [Littorina saxatilis]